MRNLHKDTYVSDAYKTLEYIARYAYCNICLHLVHLPLYQYSSVQYLKKLDILLIIILNLRNIYLH